MQTRRVSEGFKSPSLTRRVGEIELDSRTSNGRNQPVDLARRNVKRLFFRDESANQFRVSADERRLVLLGKAGELHGPSRISSEGTRFFRTRVHPNEVADQRHMKSSQSRIMRVVRGPPAATRSMNLMPKDR